MEFGSVSPEELTSIDFTLPQDCPETKIILEKSAAKKTDVYVGCAKWGRKDWVGKIYPKGTKEADYLKHYAAFFNGIELNATFYKIPSKAQTLAWKSKVGADFRFCPKVSDKISHLKRLKDVESLTSRFLDGISGFGENLGPVFLMLHPQMAPKSLETIEAFIQTLPKEIKLFVELRNPKWYSETSSFHDVFTMLERNNTGSVITDALGRRDCVHMRLTTPQAFIRFVGNGLHASDYARVDQWIQRIRLWMQQGIQSIYFFMHQQEEIHSPELSKYVIQQLNKHCRTSLKEPHFISEEPEASSSAKEISKKLS
jgi:uncharacterized protein YecE (DUF72 family)